MLYMLPCGNCSSDHRLSIARDWHHFYAARVDRTTGKQVDPVTNRLIDVAWIVNDEPLMNAGKPLATGRVRELIDILAALEPDEDEDEAAAGPAVGEV